MQDCPSKGKQVSRNEAGGDDDIRAQAVEQRHYTQITVHKAPLHHPIAASQEVCGKSMRSCVKRDIYVWLRAVDDVKMDVLGLGDSAPSRHAIRCGCISHNDRVDDEVQL